MVTRSPIGRMEANMSRYLISAREPQFTVVVGWDDGLESFFGQVDDTRIRGEDKGCLWVGASLRELLSVAELVDAIKDYADIPPEILSNLSQDFSSRHPRRPGLLRKLIETLSDSADK
jgi:hypothetical protein